MEIVRTWRNKDIMYRLEGNVVEGVPQFPPRSGIDGSKVSPPRSETSKVLAEKTLQQQEQQTH